MYCLERTKKIKNFLAVTSVVSFVFIIIGFTKGSFDSMRIVTSICVISLLIVIILTSLLHDIKDELRRLNDRFNDQITEKNIRKD